MGRVRYDSVEAWQRRARDLFGPDPRDWKFQCPLCGHVQSLCDFQKHTELDVETIERVLGFSCIGRWAKGGCETEAFAERRKREPDYKPTNTIGCDYAGGCRGVFHLNPVVIMHEGEAHERFAFAEGGKA